MANKKYVVMCHTDTAGDNDMYPLVAADDSAQIKFHRDNGCEIVCRVTCDEEFCPTMITLQKIKEQPKKTIEVPLLRACPICGGKATIDIQYSDGLYYAQGRCENCQAIGKVRENKGRINAVRAAAIQWNKNDVSYPDKVYGIKKKG